MIDFLSLGTRFSNHYRIAENPTEKFVPAAIKIDFRPEGKGITGVKAQSIQAMPAAPIRVGAIRAEGFDSEISRERDATL